MTCMKTYSITLPYTQTTSKILPTFQELDYALSSSTLVAGILKKIPEKSVTYWHHTQTTETK